MRTNELVVGALGANGALRPVRLRVVRGRLASITAMPRGTDARYAALPRVSDLHLHGANGVAISDQPSDLVRIARALGAAGVGAWLAAVASPELDTLPALARAVAAARRTIKNDPRAAQLYGLHLEGPVIAPTRAHGHNAGAISSAAALEALLASNKQLRAEVRIVTLAPEVRGALRLIRRLASWGITASLGHSEATVDDGAAGFAAGARGITHLWNEMPSYHHRAPGLIGAAFTAAAYAELVADGRHVDRSTIALTFRIFEPDGVGRAGVGRIALVSDAAASTPTRGGASDPRNADGSIKGGSIMVPRAIEVVVAAGVPLAAAIRAATETPATLLGASTLARLRVGTSAEHVLLVDARGRRAGTLASRITT
jgi:N-acetylglucosamine-6-phosphate deacetylase